MISSRALAIQSPHMPAMPQSNIHLDILEGRDEILDVTDFFRVSSTYFSFPVAHLARILPFRRSH